MSKNRFDFEQKDFSCKSWQLDKSRDVGIMDQYVGESLSIAGADMNVHRLLGVHQQGKLVDLTGNGTAISGGTANGYDAMDAFFHEDKCAKFWRSVQKGRDSILKDAYIGYNFGTPKLSTGRDRYGIDVNLREHITTVRIKQSPNPNRRASKVRIERSDDAVVWKGAAIVELDDSDDIQLVSFRQSAPARYWRVRPLSFNGNDSDFWEVVSLELISWEEPNLYHSQDEFGWVETRDRAYDTKPVTIKGYYDLYEKETDLTQFGFTVAGSIYYITVNFNDVVNRLGRPIVIGDVFELPSEAQFDPSMTNILKYIEVTDVSWSAEGYTPGWKPTLLRVIAEPMLAKQETMDIVGDLAGAIDQSGLFELDDSKYSEMTTKQNDIIVAKADEVVPLSGSDTGGLSVLDQDTVDKYAAKGIDVTKISVNPKALYVEDGLPKNGEPYTEGTAFPDTPKNGDYHRLTYVGLAESIPPRLHKYSSKKGRWMFLESDKRFKYDKQKPSIQSMRDSEQAIPMSKAGK